MYEVLTLTVSFLSIFIEKRFLVVIAVPFMRGHQGYRYLL